MSDEKLQHGLNDYLDDRLSTDERKRFEERLAGDEELALRLAKALEIRDELRDGGEDLPEAFYTRTVARFSAGRRRLPFGLSWSTAGLAVATIAVAALFVPSVLREEIPDMPATSQPREEGQKLLEESVAEKNKDDLAAKESVDLIGGLDDRKRQASNEPAPPLAQEPPPAVHRPPVRQILAEPVPESPAGADDFRESDLPRLQAAAAETGPEVERLGKGRASEGEPADELNARFLDSQRADTEERDKTLDADAVIAAVELKVDLAGAGEIELLDARDAQLRIAGNRKKESKAVPDSAAFAPSVAPNRFVAIGRRPGLDTCAALKVRRTDKAWEITYEDSGSSVGAVSCGIELPPDGVGIRFQGWPLDE